MPTAPAKPCADPRCPALRPCALHPERKPFESATPRRRYAGNGYAWDRIRQRILLRDGFQCQIRLANCTHKATHVDHIVSPRIGGTDHDMNLRASCYSCN